MEIVILSGAIALLGILIVAAAVVTSGRKERSTAEATAALTGRIDALTRRVDDLSGLQFQLSERIAGAVQATKALPEAVGAAVDSRIATAGAVLRESAAAVTDGARDAAATLDARIAQVGAAQEGLGDLKREVAALAGLLEGRRSTGTIGTVQLGDLLAHVLPEGLANRDHRLKNGQVADALVRLPNPPGPIAIDGTFPLAAWQALAQAGEDARSRATSAFRTAVLKHIVAVAERCIVRGETADAALMFVPSDAILTVLHGEHADIVETSFKARVFMVGPSTLLATLFTIRAVLRDLKTVQDAQTIAAQGAALRQGALAVAERSASLAQQLDAAGLELRALLGATGTIARALSALDAAPRVRAAE